MEYKKPTTLFAAVATVLLFAGCSGNKQSADANYMTNRAPLQTEAFIELPLGSITPRGWLREMLLSQRNGATGHLDELYPEIMGVRNGWLGGDGDQWERGPYWIDGLLPLAYILGDTALIAKTTPWIEWTLASQQPDGYFGPMTDYENEPGIQRDNSRDWWPKMVMLKVLMQYYSATGDERVPGFMSRYFRYQFDNLDAYPLDNWSFWARYRSADNMMAVYWLYNLTGEDFLLDLGRKIYSQTEPFTEMFLARERLTRSGTIHAVNLAQGLKTPVVYWQADPQSKYLTALDYAFDDLDRYHGYPTGMFSADEVIHGNDPTQGTELCTIVELMFSLETMYKITGDPKFAERLERVAYNALPAQIDDQFINRQYCQQVNQISTRAGMRNFDVNHNGLDCCFGFLTGYPCCTSNMHQGWPKFTQNLWYATPGGGVAVTQYASSEVRMLVGENVEARFSEQTSYPFRGEVTFTVEEMEHPVQFPFILRIPAWSVATTITVNGQSAQFAPDEKNLATLVREWKQGDRIEVNFTPEVRISKWKENARTVEYGPLIYSLCLEATGCEVANTGEAAVYQGKSHWEHTTSTPWNYALIECDPETIGQHYLVEVDPVKAAAANPWNEQGAPVTIRTRGVTVPAWTEHRNSAGPLPWSVMYGFETGEEAPLELIPYGCTTLRITEFPMKGDHIPEQY